MHLQLMFLKLLPFVPVIDVVGLIYGLIRVGVHSAVRVRGWVVYISFLRPGNPD